MSLLICSSSLTLLSIEKKTLFLHFIWDVEKLWTQTHDAKQRDVLTFDTTTGQITFTRYLSLVGGRPAAPDKVRIRSFILRGQEPLTF